MRSFCLAFESITVFWRICLAWVYRDYVIRAFNQDLPYDEFVRQQLAGDGMGVGEALGFLVSGPHVPAATVGQ